MREFTRKMDILYRHFFQKWELIGKSRYPGRQLIKKRAGLFDDEDGAANKENEHADNIGENVLPGRSFDTHADRKRRMEYAEASRKARDVMASIR